MAAAVCAERGGCGSGALILFWPGGVATTAVQADRPAGICKGGLVPSAIAIHFRVRVTTARPTHL